MSIIQTNLQWAYSPSRFTQPVKYLVLHHAAGNGSVEAIHAYHRDTNKWAGIAYHLYVRKDGKVYAGRPMNCQGGHCLNYNGVSIGICFEGNFETESMSVAQMTGGVEAITYAMAHYPGMKIVGHRELGSTSCPGKNFPLDYFKHYNEAGQAKKEDQGPAADTSASAPAQPPATAATEKKATESAKRFDGSIAGAYTVTANSGLHVRNDSNTKAASLVVLPKGTKVQNYGYFNAETDGKWLYIQVTFNGIKYTGFSSALYLRKQ